MRSLLSPFLALLLLFIAVGCDSNDDGNSAQERFQGTWALSGISDTEGNKLPLFLQLYNGVSANFTTSGGFILDVDAIDTPDITLEGTYTITEAVDRIILSAVVTGLGTVPLTFTYSFASDTSVTLTSDSTTSTLLNTMLGTTLVGNVTMTLSK